MVFVVNQTQTNVPFWSKARKQDVMSVDQRKWTRPRDITTYITDLCTALLYESYSMFIDEGLDGGGVWYSLFIKNLAHYSSH